ncbi:MAG: transcription antitermination factor NusB [Prevotella sp.]|jgi:N utilization substance protein B|nr:transcription antitermination factor NusB [Prevotella sp.]MBQ9178701.1 transcription antitermination factor NusB [Prevotella sp.]MBQ9670082.1 transcription antitermination factor NusB [Prevotella sp.]MBR1525707.1 transcription antitermination factor NusB [Prevotella sp.]MDY6229743.1 transcription antitermination factor NusB [Prevotella sp.]
MINRDLIRIKIVQLVYAYYQNGNRNIENAEKELLFSLSKSYDLYNFLLALIVATMREMRHRNDIATNRAKREGNPLPATKFVNNRFAIQLENNEMLNNFCSMQKVVWENDIEFIKGLCNSIEQSKIYEEYMTSDEDNYEEDREIWRRIYRTLIQDNESLDSILEEKSLYWNDDKEIVDTFVLKTIKRFDPANGDKQELLPEYKDDDDRDFAISLFRSTILNAEQYNRYMSEASYNWDLTRMPYMDVVIMQIAIAEMINFQNIPISVTINEYVNIAKLYSTRKSGGYINGILDSIARHLTANRIVLKTMDVKQKENEERTEQKQ